MGLEAPLYRDALPGLGHVSAFIRHPVNLMMAAYRELGEVFAFALGEQRLVVFIGPKYHEAVFRLTDHSLRMDLAYPGMGYAYGHVGATGPPARYMAERRCFQGAFRKEGSLAARRIVDEEALAWLEGLPASGRMDLVVEMKGLTRRIGARMTFGDGYGARLYPEFWEDFSRILRSLRGLLPPDTDCKLYRERDWARARIHERLLPLVLAERDRPVGEWSYLRSVSLSRASGDEVLEGERVIDYLLLLLASSYETTSAQLSWVLYELLQDGAYLERVVEEATALGGLGAGELGAYLDVLQLTEWAILEGERLHPATELILRYAVEEIDLEGYLIRPGDMVGLSPAVAQRIPSLFTNPDRFDPDRFGPGRQEHLGHPYAMINFGGGVHKCTGFNLAHEEMQVVIARLLTGIRLTLEGGAPGYVRGPAAASPKRLGVRYEKVGVVGLDTGGLAGLPGGATAGGRVCPHGEVTRERNDGRGI